MLLYVFLIATLNLAVGYALGAGLKLSSILALLPERTAKTKPTDIPVEEPLSRPVEASEPKEAAPAPKPTPAATRPDALASLASFRDQLSAASAELNKHQDDPEQFQQSASKLQEANHAYLEEAKDAKSQLGEMGAAGEAIESANERVAEMSSEIDGLIDSGLDDEATRTKITNTASEMKDVANEAEETALAAANEESEEPVESEDPKESEEAASDEPEAPTGESDEDIASVDELFDRLETLLESANEETTRHIAALQIDPIDGREEDQSLVGLIAKEVKKIAEEVFEEAQTLVPGTPAMALLDGDSFEEATQRLERLRQLVEAATFSVEGEELPVTITCAMADAKRGVPRDKLLEQLTLSLEESSRLGVNRTFHHDGAFPTPVEEIPVTVEPRTIAIG